MTIGIPRAQRERLRDQRAFERALVGEQTVGIVEAQMGSPIYDPQLAAPLVIPPQHALAVLVGRCVGILPLQSHPARTDASALPQWTAANFRGFFSSMARGSYVGQTTNLHGFSAHTGAHIAYSSAFCNSLT